jgi:hypothetical protein
MKQLGFFLLLTAAAVSLSAQNSVLLNTKVWIAPTVGGTAAEREFFDFNLREETRGAGYGLAETRADSDFYITTLVERDEAENINILTLALYNSHTDAELLTNGMAFTVVEDMYDWNLTMVYSLMANAPLEEGEAATNTV